MKVTSLEKKKKNKKEEIKKFLSNVFNYLQGNLRYKLYYSVFRFLLPSHIIEQYEYRLEKVLKVCYDNGQCVVCECEIPQLQFADKTCGGNCYPVMMKYREWEKYKKENSIKV